MIDEKAVNDFVRIVEWAVEDLTFTAPEDIERVWGDIGAIKEALINYKKVSIV